MPSGNHSMMAYVLFHTKAPRFKSHAPLVAFCPQKRAKLDPTIE